MPIDSPQVLGYDGEYPNLCSGTLSIWYKDHLYQLEYLLESGGDLCTTDDGDIDTNTGPWSLNKEMLPEELKPFYHEILSWVNNNVGYGCCGGCI